MWLCSELSLRGWSRGFRGGVKPLLANLCMTLCPSSSSWEWCWGAQQPDTAAQGTACPRPHFMHGETNWIASGLERAGGKGALQAEPGVSGCAAHTWVPSTCLPGDVLPPHSCPGQHHPALASRWLAAPQKPGSPCQRRLLPAGPARTASHGTIPPGQVCSGKTSCLAAGRELLLLGPCRDVP